MKNMCYNLSTKRKELTKNDNSFQKQKRKRNQCTVKVNAKGVWQRAVGIRRKNNC